MSSSLGTPYKRHRGPDTADAIIIGSGIGGLATAALLGTKLGRRAIVLERHYTAGGFTHTFRRPGYEWDVGIHYFGQVDDPARGMGAMLAGVTDGSLEWASMGDVYDTVAIGDRRWEYVTGRERARTITTRVGIRARAPYSVMLFSRGWPLAQKDESFAGDVYHSPAGQDNDRRHAWGGNRCGSGGRAIPA